MSDSTPVLTNRQTIDRYAAMVDLCQDMIDKRDARIADLSEQLARVTQELDGTHEANLSLFADKARLIREVTLLQAERAEGWGR